MQQQKNRIKTKKLLKNYIQETPREKKRKVMSIFLFCCVFAGYIVYIILISFAQLYVYMQGKCCIVGELVLKEVTFQKFLRARNSELKPSFLF